MTKKTRCSNAKTANSNAVQRENRKIQGGRQKRKVQQTLEFTGLFWRSGWDSNPRTLADQLISSQSRYDHFDTSPYLSQHQHLRKWGELMGRTKKNIKLKIPEKPRKIKGFQSRSYRKATTISSQPRYDHFDTSPYYDVRKTLNIYCTSLMRNLQAQNVGKMI